MPLSANEDDKKAVLQVYVDQVDRRRTINQSKRKSHTGFSLMESRGY